MGRPQTPLPASATRTVAWSKSSDGIESVALLAPTDDGSKRIPTVQEPPGATLRFEQRWLRRGFLKTAASWGIGALGVCLPFGVR